MYTLKRPMKDVTDLVQRYRLALRQIWNQNFYSDPELRDWESVEVFRELKLPLFNALVAHPLRLERPTGLFGTGFEVVPDMTEGVRGIGSLLVNRTVPSSLGGGVWEHLSGPFGAGAFKATLFDFVDWMPLAYIDLQYYEVLIDEFPADPTKVGQHALVEPGFVRVYWREEPEIVARESSLR
jgi:hypothetical protein